MYSFRASRGIELPTEQNLVGYIVGYPTIPAMPGFLPLHFHVLFWLYGVSLLGVPLAPLTDHYVKERQVFSRQRNNEPVQCPSIGGRPGIPFPPLTGAKC
jgi:hypothetical protein